MHVVDVTDTSQVFNICGMLWYWWALSETLKKTIVDGRGGWIEAISMCSEQRVSKVLNEDKVCHLACTVVTTPISSSWPDHFIKTNASSVRKEEWVEVKRDVKTMAMIMIRRWKEDWFSVRLQQVVTVGWRAWSWSSMKLEVWSARDSVPQPQS